MLFHVSDVVIDNAGDAEELKARLETYWQSHKQAIAHRSWYQTFVPTVPSVLFASAATAVVACLGAANFIRSKL